MSNLDLEKIIFPNDNNTYIIRDAQAHTDLANKANKDGSNIVGPWTMNITGHASQDIASTEKRQPGGVAELDQNGLIITSQLPSSVDEIIEGYYYNSKFYEDAEHTKEITGEASKIYIDLDTNQTYRWSGSTYVEISPSIALGVEHSTAGYGDWTNTAYLHATDANKISAAIASGLYKIAATSEGHIAGLTAVTKADITALGIPAQDTTYTQGTGISIDNNNVINHSNSVTAGTAKGDDSKTLTFGGTFTIPSVTYDAQGHITTKGTTTMTMPGNPNTDRYVNSAAFAHDSTNDNVKMTLTRAGSDTAIVTANIPKVSSSSSGVAPKGASVSSQSQNTKFLREDGTWAKPSYTTNTNTTYTLGTSGNTVTLTPSSGSVQSITVPFATNATKATQDASGNTITTTYRRLDNNTFDTISVTDLTAGDVVVTGVGRFTNGLYGNLTGNADTATKATQDGSGNVITSTYLLLKTAGGIAYCSANGANNYFQIATITIGATYVNYPIVFELSGRGHAFTKLNVMFTNANNTDPGLKDFITDGYDQYWIKKTATSTWVLYGKYSEAWGGETLHRISGMGFNKVTVTVDMTNYGTTAPSDATQAVYGWNCANATKADTISTEVGTAAGARPIFYSYLDDTSKVVYDRTFNYDPSGGLLQTTSLSVGKREITSAPSSAQQVNRITIVPYYHTGGPWYIASKDDSSLAYLTIKYNTSEKFNFNTNGLFTASGINITGSAGVNVNFGNLGTSGGLSLYGAEPATYGIAMRQTSNQGKHGGVQSDWGIYNFMYNVGTNRGWIWRDSSRSTNVASIDCIGNAVFNGYVGIGGNVTNTSGVRAQYNSTTKSLDFVFVT